MAEATGRRMTAVRFHDYGDPSILVVDEVARPQPKPGEVLVRVRAAGVNAIDWKFRAGYLKDFMPLEFPHVPGLDLAGTVEQLGDGVSDFAVGDGVFGRGVGTYAEYAIAPVTTLAHKPPSISFEQAATLGVGGPPGQGSLIRRSSRLVSNCWCMAAREALVRWPCSWGGGRVHM